MGPVIVLLVLAFVVSLGILGAVARPHLSRPRHVPGIDRHRSRTQRARS